MITEIKRCENAKVGDKVWSCIHGAGEITQIADHRYRPIGVDFPTDRGVTHFYTTTGRRNDADLPDMGDLHPELYNSVGEFMRERMEIHMDKNGKTVDPALTEVSNAYAGESMRAFGNKVWELFDKQLLSASRTYDDTWKDYHEGCRDSLATAMGELEEILPRPKRKVKKTMWSMIGKNNLTGGYYTGGLHDEKEHAQETGRGFALGKITFEVEE